LYKKTDIKAGEKRLEDPVSSKIGQQNSIQGLSERTAFQNQATIIDEIGL